MIPPIGNLLLAFIAVIAAFVYPKLPAPPFSSDLFTSILQWLLTLVAGWNVSSASKKSALPTFKAWFQKKSR